MRTYYDTPIRRIYDEGIINPSTGFCLTDKFFTCDSSADTSTNELIIVYGDVWAIVYVPRLEPIQKERYFLVMAVVRSLYPYWVVIIEGTCVFALIIAIILLMAPFFSVESGSRPAADTMMGTVFRCFSEVRNRFFMAIFLSSVIYETVDYL